MLHLCRGVNTTSHLGVGRKREPGMLGFDRITFDPQVMGGRACLRGTRVTASLVVNLTANGMTAQDIIAAYPYLEPEDVQEALRYAAWLAEETIQPLLPAAA